MSPQWIPSWEEFEFLLSAGAELRLWPLSSLNDTRAIQALWCVIDIYINRGEKVSRFSPNISKCELVLKQFLVLDNSPRNV